MHADTRTNLTYTTNCCSGQLDHALCIGPLGEDPTHVWPHRSTTLFKYDVNTEFGPCNDFPTPAAWAQRILEHSLSPTGNQPQRRIDNIAAGLNVYAHTLDNAATNLEWIYRAYGADMRANQVISLFDWSQNYEATEALRKHSMKATFLSGLSADTYINLVQILGFEELPAPPPPELQVINELWQTLLHNYNVARFRYGQLMLPPKFYVFRDDATRRTAISRDLDTLLTRVHEANFAQVVVPWLSKALPPQLARETAQALRASLLYDQSSYD